MRMAAAHRVVSIQSANSRPHTSWESGRMCPTLCDESVSANEGKECAVEMEGEWEEMGRNRKDKIFVHEGSGERCDMLCL